MPEFEKGIMLKEVTLSELINHLQTLQNNGYGDKPVVICGEGPVCIYAYSNIICIDNNDDLFDDD